MPGSCHFYYFLKIRLAILHGGGVGVVAAKRSQEMQSGAANIALLSPNELEQRRLAPSFVTPKCRDQVRTQMALHNKISVAACLHHLAVSHDGPDGTVARSGQVHKDELYCRVCHKHGHAPTIFTESCVPRLIAATRAGKRPLLDATALEAELASDTA